MQTTLPLPIKLNFFSEDAPPTPSTGDGTPPPTDPTPPPTDGNPPPTNAPTEPPKPADTPPPVDIASLIAAQFEAYANKQSEAEKLGKMSKEEREAHEKQAKEDDINKRLAEVTKKELRIEAHKLLTEKDMPIELLDVLQYTDADSCNLSIASVEKAFRAAVEKGVNARLRGKTPQGSNPNKTVITMEQIKNMSQAEIMANMGEIEKTLQNQ